MIEPFLTKRVLASLLPILVVVMQACCSWGATEAYNGIAKPGCPDECGGVKIPFPFGIGPGCYFISNVSGNVPRDTFRIVCKINTSDPPKPLIPILGNREVLSISVQDHTIRVSSGVAYDCYNTGESVPSSIPNLTYVSGNYRSRVPVLMSTTRNRFVSIGCDTRAFLDDAAGCITSCLNMDPRYVRDGVCESDLGCCESLINKNMTKPTILVGSTSNHTLMGNDRTQPCGYAFVAEVGWYNFSAFNLTATAKDCYDYRVPLVYDWFLGFLVLYENCSKFKADEYHILKLVCSSNSMFECTESVTPPFMFYFSYLKLSCGCRQGYSGNPYLPNGCQDINECLDESTHNCQKTEYCVNKEEGYDCRCPARHLGNGTIASPCIHVPGDTKLILGVSIGTGSMIGFILLYSLYKLIKWRKEIKEREHNFKRNGGLLLQQEMTTNEGAINRTKIFNRIELEKAADNFNINRVLGHGGQGTVYKGMLTDGTIVAVKKSKKVDENQLAQFINEVVILSQINHRNVVKLFGCCLETDVPLLVYEFVPNGTLYQHIHHPSEDFHMTWKVRSQIAVECARAVAYLHSSCSSPIYHRDIKSSNILLDEKYKAKVSDFGTSRTISIDKTHVTTCVQGTFGYLDPEFFRSSQFSEKSDVYSFGVVLLELITSKKPIFTNTFREPRGLAIEFVQIMETSPDQLYGILDTQVSQNCSKDEIDELSKLIERCLSMNGRQRPTMTEVAMTLEMIIKSQQDKDGTLVAEQEIRGEERHVWIEEMSTTNEDPSINSTINLPR